MLVRSSLSDEFCTLQPLNPCLTAPPEEEAGASGQRAAGRHFARRPESARPSGHYRAGPRGAHAHGQCAVPVSRLDVMPSCWQTDGRIQSAHLRDSRSGQQGSFEIDRGTTRSCAAPQHRIVRHCLGFSIDKAPGLGTLSLIITPPCHASFVCLRSRLFYSVLRFCSAPAAPSPSSLPR